MGEELVSVRALNLWYLKQKYSSLFFFDNHTILSASEVLPSSMTLIFFIFFIFPFPKSCAFGVDLYLSIYTGPVFPCSGSMQ